MLRRVTQSEGFDAFEDRLGDSEATKKRKYGGKKFQVTDEVEEKLETLVFGKLPFQAVGEDSKALSEDDEEHTRGSVTGPQPKLPVWQDEDDAQLSVDIAAHPRSKKLRRTDGEAHISGEDYSNRLKAQFEKLTSRPSWAQPQSQDKGDDQDSSEGEEEEGGGGGDGLLQRTGRLLSRSRDLLPKGRISMKKMVAANHSKKAEAVVQSVEFHPTSNVILTAGFHKTLDLFQVDGDSNPHLQSVHIPGFPITTAHFTPDGREVVMAGHKKSFHVYDMMAGKIMRIYNIRGRREQFFDNFVVSPDNALLVFLGKDGYMPLVSNRTKQWVANLKMNGAVKDVTFSADGRKLLSTGSDGKVYVWDMTTRDCVHCFVDDGCVIGTTVSISPNGKYVACGADSGVVNVYDTEQCLKEERPKPLKSVMSLTTPIKCTKFNPSSEILAIASHEKKDAFRLIHTASCTVFSNWPKKETPLNYVYSCDFSPMSNYLAIGNAKGKALLYRLNHYCR